MAVFRYRAYDKSGEDNTMYYDVIPIPHRGELLISFDGKGYDTVDINHYHVMAGVEYPDNGGTVVYENDVMQYDQYYDPFGKFVYDREHNGFMLFTGFEYLYQEDFGIAKIIGNTLENPEMEEWVASQH